MRREDDDDDDDDDDEHTASSPPRRIFPSSTAASGLVSRVASRETVSCFARARVSPGLPWGVTVRCDGCGRAV
jgi:hypothetical protein